MRCLKVIDTLRPTKGAMKKSGLYQAVPIIRDRHVVRHKNLGGACYVYLMNAKDEDRTFDVLRDTEGVEDIYRRSEAARKFRLHHDRIGDLFMLGENHIAVGALNRAREDIAIRSNGRGMNS